MEAEQLTSEFRPGHNKGRPLFGYRDRLNYYATDRYVGNRSLLKIGALPMRRTAERDKAIPYGDQQVEHDRACVSSPTSVPAGAGSRS
jgi:hypothetical protein